MADTRTAAEQSLETAREAPLQQFAVSVRQSPDFQAAVEQAKAELLAELARTVDSQHQGFTAAQAALTFVTDNLLAADTDMQQARLQALQDMIIARMQHDQLLEDALRTWAEQLEEATNAIGHFLEDTLTSEKYWHEVGQVFLGYKDAGVNAAIGLAIAATPMGQVLAIHGMVQLGKALYHDPRGTINGMWNQFEEKLSTNRGRGEVIGDVLISFATGALLKGAQASGQMARLTRRPPWRRSNGSAPTRATAFFADADPARRVMGPARLSHADEIAGMRRLMEAEGVEIIERSGTMAYGPSSRTGQPGQFIIDPDASYSAWKHEFRHFSDDQASGWDGMSALMDKNTRWTWESAAYAEEISMMRRLGRYDIIADLIELRTKRLTNN